MKNEYKTARIVKIERESDRVKTFTLDTSVAARPGQYVMVWIPRLNEKPFGVLTDKPLRFSIANVGPFTQKIHALRVGDRMTFRGPYGEPFTLKGKRLLLVAGGYGVVPLYFFASKLSPAQQKNTMVIIGAKTKKQLSLVDRFKKLKVRVYVATDDGSQGFKGYTTDLASGLLVKHNVDMVYTCGPEVMMEKIVQLAKKHAIQSQVSIERYFKCGGMGLCGACSFHGKFVCIDGPVFSGDFLLSNAAP